MTPVVSAILVNFNAGPELRRALQSIADELQNVEWDAVVVDNASSDGSAEIALEFKPQTTLLRNLDNVGFARGVNMGLSATTAPLVLIMNPDCRLMAGAVATLRTELDANPSCVIAAPKILNPDGSLQGSARGDPDMLTGLFGRTGSGTRLLPWLSLSRRNVVTDDAVRSGASSVVVDWVSGACMFARREAFVGVHGFDERYFLYWEDADLCRRLRARGLHTRYVPGAVAIHRVGHSSRASQVLATKAFHDSAYLYYATHVASHRLDPKRPLAGLLLGARRWWMTRRLAES